MTEINQNSPHQLNNPSLLARPDQIFSVSWKNLVAIKPEWLEDEHILYELKLFVLDVSDSGDPADASRLFDWLHNALKQVPRLPQERPDVFKEYLRMLAVLKASFLAIMPDGDVHKFLREELLLALEVQDFEVRDKFQEIFSLYREYPDGLANLAQELLHPIQENQEILGTEPLSIPGREYTELPKVKNWLIDYIHFAMQLTRSGVVLRTGGLERAAYLAKSPNVQRLTVDEKELLMRLLELYDWLKSFIPSPLVSGGTPAHVYQQKIMTPLPPTPAAPRPLAPAPVARVLPTPPRPPAPPPKKPIDEGLYQSTLEELKRMREEQGRLAAPPAPQRPVSASPPASVRPPIPSVAMPAPAAAKPPLQAVPISRPAQAPASITPQPPVQLPTREPFSVNEAIIHAGQVPTSEQGGIVPPEEYADQKLEDLRDKTKGPPPPPAPP